MAPTNDSASSLASRRSGSPLPTALTPPVAPVVLVLILLLAGLYDSAQLASYERMRGAHYGLLGGLARNLPFWVLWIVGARVVALAGRFRPPIPTVHSIGFHAATALVLGVAHIATWVVLRDFLAHGNFPPVDYGHLVRKFVPSRIGMNIVVYAGLLALTVRPAAGGPDAPERPRRPGSLDRDRLVLTAGGRIYVISRAATERVEAEGDYMRIFGDVQSLVRITLRELGRRLGPGFARVSRSTLVNVAHIREIRRVGGERWEALMVSGERVPVTSAYRDALDAALTSATRPLADR